MGMIDIHCHILCGIDDGAKDLNESLEMARIAYEDGIRHIIATPHFNHTFMNDRAIVLNKLHELQTALDEAGIQIRIHPGSEIRIEDQEFFEEHDKMNSFYFLGHTEKFVLLEQRWENYEPSTLAVFQSLRDRGITPIIPHPERHWFFRDNPELLAALIDAGAWTQVSVDSLLGKNNEEAQNFSEWLIAQGWLHTLATDAHNVTRKPNLSLGYERVRQLAGEQRCREIASRAEGII
jgi:protein-tyrosine phosphatase